MPIPAAYTAFSYQIIVTLTRPIALDMHGWARHHPLDFAQLALTSLHDITCCLQCKRAIMAAAAHDACMGTGHARMAIYPVARSAAAIVVRLGLIQCD
jgi:hypothetical protein